jgi:ABC-2 type transport system ATP-binding protein
MVALNTFTPDRSPSGATIAATVRNMSKAFSGLLAVQQLSLTVRQGEICALGGANGGGKTTTIRVLAGLLLADEGEGSILGCDLMRDRTVIRQRVGYLAQRSTLYGSLSALENLRFRAAVFGSPRSSGAAREQLRRFGLGDVASMSVSQLSGGLSRQVELAAALIHRPQLLLLDEPTAGLDPVARNALWRRLVALAAEGTAIILSTHDLSEATRCAQVLLLSEGRIRMRGAPQEILRQIAACSLLVSGADVLSLIELEESALVLAADPTGSDMRLVVAAEQLDMVEALLKARGYKSLAVGLTLEDAVLAVARRTRHCSVT